jgi:hypothetical protein
MTGYPKFLVPPDYLGRADEFFQAYADLPVRDPPNWPRYFMLCHAIELTLKSYLFAKGKTVSELSNRAFGHNLRNLLTEAVSAGLPLGKLSYDEIQLLDEAHGKYWARYPRETAGPIFVIEPFEPYALELIGHVRRSIRGDYSASSARD